MEIATHFSILDFLDGSGSKAPVYNVGYPGSLPGSGRSPGEGNGNQLQYSYLENPMDRGAWEGIVHGVAKSWTRLSDFTFLSFSILAWEISWTEKPWAIGSIGSIGSQRVRHD